MEETGGSYYNFGKFVVEQSTVKITFGFTGMANGEFWGTSYKFDCWKVGDEWKVKGKQLGVYHGYYQSEFELTIQFQYL